MQRDFIWVYFFLIIIFTNKWLKNKNIKFGKEWAKRGLGPWRTRKAGGGTLTSSLASSKSSSTSFPTETSPSSSSSTPPATALSPPAHLSLRSLSLSPFHQHWTWGMPTSSLALYNCCCRVKFASLRCNGGLWMSG